MMGNRSNRPQTIFSFHLRVLPRGFLFIQEIGTNSFQSNTKRKNLPHIYFQFFSFQNEIYANYIFQVCVLSQIFFLLTLTYGECFRCSAATERDSLYYILAVRKYILLDRSVVSVKSFLFLPIYDVVIASIECYGTQTNQIDDLHTSIRSRYYQHTNIQSFIANEMHCTVLASCKFVFIQCQHAA